MWWCIPAASSVNSYGKKNAAESDPLRERRRSTGQSVRRTAAPSRGSIFRNLPRAGLGAVAPERNESVDGGLIDLPNHAVFPNPAAVDS
jgi:hypothetical protein